MEESWAKAQASGVVTEVRYRLRMTGGNYRWHRARVVPIWNGDGPLIEWIGIFTDIDQLVRRDDGMRFLAEASAAPTESLDESVTLDTLARLAVDNLADGCMVTLARPDGAFEHAATRSSDDNVTASYAAETERLYPFTGNATSGYPLAIRTGVPELVPEGTFDQQVLPAIAADAVHLERLRKLDMYSAMVLPLVARGSTLGAIALGATWTASAPSIRRARSLSRHRVGAPRCTRARQRASFRGRTSRSPGRARVAELTRRLQEITASFARAINVEGVADIRRCRTDSMRCRRSQVPCTSSIRAAPRSMS